MDGQKGNIFYIMEKKELLKKFCARIKLKITMTIKKAKYNKFFIIFQSNLP